VPDQPDDLWLVVGLGNPGPRYVSTPHNVGYLVVDELASRLGGSLRSHRSRRADVLAGRLELGGPRLVLGRARAYMNESGGPVKTLVDFYRVPPERLVVVHDEIDLPFGSIRLKLGGGDNGHNGLKSVRAVLGTGDFCRVRVGVGRPVGPVPPATYVLSRWTSQREEELPSVVSRSADAVESLTKQGLEATQSQFNS
jgi:PTH1 family peptidyl-tRNA hydrolase